MTEERSLEHRPSPKQSPRARLKKSLSLNEAGDFEGCISILRDLYDETPEGWLRRALESEPLATRSGTVGGWFFVAAAASLAISWFNLAVMTWGVEGREEIALDILKSAQELGSEDAPTILAEYLEWLKRPLEAEEAILSTLGAGGALSGRAAGLLGRIRFEARGLTDDETLGLLTTASKTSSEFEITRGLVAIRRGDVKLAGEILQSPQVASLHGLEQLRQELSTLG